MPRVSGFDTLTAEHRAWLVREWRATGYGQNERLAEELAARLRADDPTASAPDASTVHRWAQAERARARQIKYAAQLRAATLAELPKDQPGLSDRVGAYLEGRLVEALEDLDGIAAELDPLARLAALTEAHRATTARRRVDVAKAQAHLARERFEAEQAIRAEERAKAAGAAEGAARAQGLSPDGIAALRAAIMGAL